MLKSVVQGVQLAALALAAFTIVMLFANEPDDPAPLGAGTGDRAVADGADVFAAECARCHGADGAGGLGPSLVGVEERLTVEEHVAVVSSGRGIMPSFSDSLTPEQIDLVVAYTRDEL